MKKQGVLKSFLRCLKCLTALLALCLVLASCDVDNGGTTTYTVTFDADGGTRAPAQQTIAHGGKVTEPPYMTKANFGFGGWFKEVYLINQWDFATDTVTGDITLYAKWDSDFFTVKFDADGGRPVPVAQDIASGGKIVEPPAMTKTDYAFGGWYTEAEFLHRWDSATDTVTEKITLYARWNSTYATEGLLFTLLSGGNAYSVSKGTATAAEVVIPPVYEGLPVTEIAAGGFYNYTNMTSVTIHNSVTSIGSGAFYYCRGLTSVTIPDSVTSIGREAFYGCSGLTGALTIPASVTSIGSSAFYYCSGLTSVTIPDSVTSIDSSAFYGCSGLTRVLTWSRIIQTSQVRTGYCITKQKPSLYKHLEVLAEASRYPTA